MAFIHAYYPWYEGVARSRLFCLLISFVQKLEVLFPNPRFVHQTLNILDSQRRSSVLSCPCGSPAPVAPFAPFALFVIVFCRRCGEPWGVAWTRSQGRGIRELADQVRTR